MILKSKLFNQISIYTANNLLNSGLSFILLPVFTKYLLPDQFGILALMNTGIVFLMPFILLGTNGFIQVKFHQDKANFNAYFSNSFYSTLSGYLFFQLLGIGLYCWGGSFSEVPRILFIVVPPLAFLQANYQMLLAYFQITERSLTYSKVNITNTVLNISLVLLFLMQFHLKWEARLFSSLTSLGVLFIFFLFYFSRQGHLFSRPDGRRMSEVLAFGGPLIPHALGALTLDFAAKLIITAKLGAAYNGIYSLASQIAFIISILDLSISLAYTPYIYKKMAEGTEEAKRNIVKISFAFMLFMTFCYFMLVLGTPILFRLFIDPRYTDSISLVYIIAGGFLFSSYYKVFVAPIFYYKKTKYLAYVGIFNVVLGISVTYWLVGQYGLKGAAFSSCISFFVFTIIIAILSNRIYKLPWLFYIKNRTLPK